MNELKCLCGLILLCTGCWLLNKGHPEATTEVQVGVVLMFFAGFCAGLIRPEGEEKK